VTTFYIVHVQNDGRGGGDDPRTLGPFKAPADQVDAARKIRDENLQPEDRLFWMDITHGHPHIGVFDPKFFEDLSWDGING
jgi:hypothetical protein